MGKSNPNLEDGKDIKTRIPITISRAIDQIYTASGRSESEILRDALYQYIKSQYPEFLPKTNLEIENKAKADRYYKKYYESYEKEQTKLESIPIYEKGINDADKKLMELDKEIEETEDKLRTLGIDKKDKPLLKKRLDHLLQQKKFTEQSKSDYEHSLRFT